MSFLLADVLLSSLMCMCRQGVHEDVAEEQLADRIFEQAYIPRRLEEVQEYERDHDRLAGELRLNQHSYYQERLLVGILSLSGALAVLAHICSVARMSLFKFNCSLRVQPTHKQICDNRQHKAFPVVEANCSILSGLNSIDAACCCVEAH